MSEGILAILLAGGIEPQAAAWALDALSLYVSAYALERSLVRQRGQDDDGWVVGRDELVDRSVRCPPTASPTPGGTRPN
ncbi:MAG TPA: hypothetical protein VGN37_08695 [Actinocatenispora sp.]